jgi:hypothetical protein
MSLRSPFVVPAVSLVLAATLAPPVSAQAPKRPAWVEKSDAHARVLVDVLARFAPESAAQFGVEGLDTAIFDLKPGRQERTQQELRGALASLEKKLAAETDPLVRQDLEILIDSASPA